MHETDPRTDSAVPSLERVARDVNTLEDALENVVQRYSGLRDRLAGAAPTAVAERDARPPSHPGMVPGIAIKVDHCNTLAGELIALIVALEEIA